MSNDPPLVVVDEEAEAAEKQKAEAARKEAMLRANVMIQNLLYRDGLYQTIDLTTPDGIFVRNFMEQGLWFNHDMFCPTCKMVTPYVLRTAALEQPESDNRWRIRTRANVIAINAVCQRIAHWLTFVLIMDGKWLTKIGQHPSSADIAIGELRSIQNSLDVVDRRELSRALGLFAHDTHLGAFVYLRRVFERIILRAHDRHVSAGFPDVPGFTTMRMDDRIEAVHDQLPASVVTNRRVFAVLSKGIHELSEEEAGELFPIVKQVIFQMLAEEERLKDAREQEARTNAEFRKVLVRLSAGDGGA